MIEDPLIDSMARTLWVNAWADWNESYGKVNTSGKELMDIAPRTPKRAALMAALLLGRFVRANGDWGVWWVVKLASEAEGIEWEEVCAGWHNLWLRDLGHCLVMMALGSGVSWFDDHAEFELVIPSEEVDISGFFDALQWGRSKYRNVKYRKEDQPNDN